MKDGWKNTRLGRIVPGVALLVGYEWRWLRRDLAAAIAIGAMLIPQGMAYAYLAGLEPTAGLWAGVVSFVAYAFFGPSRQLMVGPEAGTAILTLAVMSPLGITDPAQYATVTAGIALIVGLILLVAGFLRLGAIADFLSQPLLVGYLNGMALIMLASQLATMTGLEREAQDFIPQIREVMEKSDQIHLPTVWLSLATIATLLLFRYFLPRFPGSVVAVVVTTALSALLDLGDHLKLVGPIERGFPSIGLPPAPELSVVVDLIPGILGLSLLGYASAVLTSRAFADKNRYKTDANQEFFGLAASNVLSGLIGGFPVAASESRTAVGDLAGGRTQMVSLLGAGVVLGVVAFLSKAIALLPRATLAAVVVVAGLLLIDVRSIGKLARARPSECAIAVLTTAGVLIFGILPGILIAVALATLDLVRHATRPHDAVLGKVRGKPGYHGIDAEGPASVVPGLLVYRLDGPLFFANARFMRERVRELTDALDEPSRLVVIDAGAVFDIDYTAANALHRLHSDLEERGSDLAIAEPHERIRDVLRRTGLLQEIGDHNIFPTVRAAIEGYLHRSREEGRPLSWERADKDDLPL